MESSFRAKNQLQLAPANVDQHGLDQAAAESGDSSGAAAEEAGIRQNRLQAESAEKRRGNGQAGSLLRGEEESRFGSGKNRRRGQR